MRRYPSFSLNDLIENGNDAYDDFDDLPYEARQALINHSHDFTFEEMQINPRYLYDDFRLF